MLKDLLEVWKRVLVIEGALVVALMPLWVPYALIMWLVWS